MHHQYANSTAQPPAETAGESARFSPLRFLIITIGGIFIAEVIAMLVLLNFQNLPYYLQILMDATIMVLLIFPLIYYFSLRPLLLQIKKRQQAEESLHTAYEEMELRVQERTEELRDANADLEEEINVRRRAETALRESEQRLSRAQEIAHLGSWELDLFSGQLTWSDEVYRIFGLQPQEFGATYEAFLEAVHPEDRMAVDEAYSRSIRESRNTYEIEHRVVRQRSGEVRFVHEKCEHLRDVNGQIVKSVGMVHDITEQRLAGEQLRYQAALLSNVNDAIIASDAQFRITAWNSTAESLYGWKAEEVIGRNGLEIVQTEWSQTDPDEMRRTINKRGRWRGEATQMRRDGTRFPVEVSSLVLRDDSGKVAGYISVNRDITERKQNEEQIERSNQKLNEILESIQDDFYVLNREWNFVYASRRFTSRVGKEPEDFIGNSIWEMFPKHVGTVLEENFRAAMEKREVRRFEVGGKYTPTWYRMRVYPSAEGITVLGTDITEHKKAEEALQKSEALLRGVLNQMPSGVTVRDAFTGELILSNARSREILGDLVGTTDQLSQYRGLHSNGTYYQSEEWPLFRSLATGEIVEAEEMDFERSSGTRGTLSISSAPIMDAQGQIISGVAVFHDITERKKVERELQQLNRTLQAHTASSKAMLRATNETELLDEVCKIVVEVCGHAMVWIGYAQDDEEKSVCPVASAGFEAGYLETLQITWANTEWGRGPTGTAIRSGKLSSCRNMLSDPQFAPWREQALQRGYASSIVLPLILDERTFGAVTIYSRQTDAFSPDEEKLLTDLAKDLAHGIEMIRLRQAHERATAALRESEERFRLALTHAPVTVAVQDRDLRYTWAYNQRTRSVAEIIGKTDVDLFPSEAEQLTALKRRVIETGENASGQFWINSNNHRIFLDVFIEPLKNEMGEIDGVGLATVDLTAIKSAEEALQASEAKYRNLFENMTEEVHFWELLRDEAGNIKTWRLVDANPPSLKSWGRQTIDEIRGCTTDEIFGSGAAKHYMPIVQKIMTEYVPYSYEDYFAHLDKYFRFTSVPLGEYFITTGADITNIKKAEEVLRRAHDELELRVQERTEELAVANQELLKEILEREKVERQLRVQTTAMEVAANGMVITDQQGNIQWTNPALTHMTGYTAQEMIGQGMRLFRSGKHDADFYQQMWGTIHTGNVWHGEITNRRKDGNFYIEEQTITPVRDSNGQISHFIAIKQDITERKLVYAQLEESNRELTSISMLEHQQRLLAEGLVESSVVLNMNLELDSLLDHIFEQTRQTIPYLIADIMLIKNGVAHIARQWGFEDHSEARTLFLKQDGIPIHKFPIWEGIYLTRSPMWIPDTGLEDSWEPYFGMTWIRSYLAAPLIYADEVIGIINLGSDQPNAFREAMANNLKAFAASAAVAIQNARLYEAEQRNRKVAEILSEASVALSQTLDIQRVMETILDYIELVLPAHVALLILSEGEDQYRIRCVRASESQAAVKTLLDRSIDLLSEPVLKPFFEKESSTLIRDAETLQAWNPPSQLAAMRSWLGIPLTSTGKTIGMVLTTNVHADAFNGDQIELAEAVVSQATVALQNAWLFEQVRAGRERLQLLSRHLVEIQENERKYIARELHDETSQTLTSLKLGLHAIEQSSHSDPAIGNQVANLKILADEILESLHRLAMNLRPASLDHLGLVEALTSLVQSTGDRSGIVARFKSLGLDQRNRLTDDIESSVYRIVQESLTNIVRHAKATCADVILEWQEDQIMVIVEDDGVGIDLPAARSASQLGLVGMQERTEMLGGRLLIDSNPNAGTTLVVEIPYAH